MGKEGEAAKGDRKPMSEVTSLSSIYTLLTIGLVIITGVAMVSILLLLDGSGLKIIEKGVSIKNKTLRKLKQIEWEK